MSNLAKRLDKLEQMLPGAAPALVFLDIPGLDHDLMSVGGEWVPCDGLAVLEQFRGHPIKVIGGLDPRAL